MKNVPIKFRGKRLDNGKYVFGDLVRGLGKDLYYDENVTRIAFGNGFNEIRYIEVDPETVTQLLGYDANGEEIYEGDNLIIKRFLGCGSVITIEGCAVLSSEVKSEGNYRAYEQLYWAGVEKEIILKKEGDENLDR